MKVWFRTLHRDVDQLSAAGVPIYALRGRAGGFALQDGWKTSLTGLTQAESHAVFLARLAGPAGPAAQLGLGPDVESAKLKLLAAMLASSRADAQRISAKLHLDPVDWYRQSQPVPHLGVIAEAVWREQRRAMRYQSWRRVAAPTLDSLGLVLKAGDRYLVAGLGDGPLTFKVSMIRQAEVLAEPVLRPKAFELADYWVESTQRFERALAQAVAAAPPTSQRKHGRVKLRIPTESVARATGHRLRLAPEVEVIEPEALRRSMVERIQQVGALYKAFGAGDVLPASASGATAAVYGKQGRGS